MYIDGRVDVVTTVETDKKLQCETREPVYEQSRDTGIEHDTTPSTRTRPTCCSTTTTHNTIGTCDRHVGRYGPPTHGAYVHGHLIFITTTWAPHSSVYIAHEPSHGHYR